MANFQSILDQSPAGVKAPRALPQGTYHVLCEGRPTYREVGEDKLPTFSLRLKILGARDDVDQEELAHFVDGIQGKTLFHTVWLAGNDMDRVKFDAKQCLNAFGVDTEDQTKSYGQLFEEMAGRQALANVRKVVDKRTNADFVNDIRGFAAL